MGKRYSTTYSNGTTVESSSAHEAFNWVCYDDQQVWMLSGKPVSYEEFITAVQAARDAALDKKLETHKRVKVLHGSSVANYVHKWVRR